MLHHVWQLIARYSSVVVGSEYILSQSCSAVPSVCLACGATYLTSGDTVAKVSNGIGGPLKTQGMKDKVYGDGNSAVVCSKVSLSNTTERRL